MDFLKQFVDSLDSELAVRSGCFFGVLLLMALPFVGQIGEYAVNRDRPEEAVQVRTRSNSLVTSGRERS